MCMHHACLNQDTGLTLGFSDGKDAAEPEVHHLKMKDTIQVDLIALLIDRNNKCSKGR